MVKITEAGTNSIKQPVSNCIHILNRAAANTKIEPSLAVHNGDCYSAPRALLILEAQASLATFLRNFVDDVLAGVDELTIEEDLGNFALASFENGDPLQTRDSPWVQVAMDYYNVSDSYHYWRCCDKSANSPLWCV